MKRLDFVRWLVVVLGSWLMPGNASGAVGGVGCEGMAGVGKTAVPWSAVGAVPREKHELGTRASFFCEAPPTSRGGNYGQHRNKGDDGMERTI